MLIHGHKFTMIYYASSVWYHSLKQAHQTKLNSYYNSLLRTAKTDFRMKLKQTELTELCQRSTPEQWAKFITASRVIKIMGDKQQVRLAEKFWDKSVFKKIASPESDCFLIVPVSKKGNKHWRIYSCSCAQSIILGIETKFD